MLNKIKFADLQKAILDEEIAVLTDIEQTQNIDYSAEKVEAVGDMRACKNLDDLLNWLDARGNSFERILGMVIEVEDKPETEGERIIREIFEQQERLKKEYYEWLSKQG
jgi:hypothetical protein